MLKKAILVLLCAATVSPCARGQQEALATIERARSLLPKQSFVERGRITIHVNDKKIEGDYFREQLDGTQWREQIDLPGYRETRIVKSQHLWVDRTTGAQPVPIHWLLTAMHPEMYLSVLPDERVGSLKNRKENGRPVSCVDITKEHRSREICVDKQEGSITVIATRGKKFIYEGSTAVGGGREPMVIRVSEATTPMASAVLSPASSTGSVDLTAAPQARDFGWCADGIPPVALDKPAPRYPPVARTLRLRGTTSIYAVIEPDGHLSNLAVVGSAGKELDDASMQTVAQWQYRPATCGRTAVRTETIIMVNYTNP